MRTISGNSALSLPYWDYYTNPNIPSEFTDQATGNPLYQARTNTNVYNALDLAPFNSDLYNFQRNTSNAFEPQLEGKPHNPVHDIIGGVMTTMRSPTDPIFYLHHCNIDRLTHAWALPDGKGIPYTAFLYSSSTSNPYWAGRHVYASGLTMARSLTYDPSYLNYGYANLDVPTALPLAAAPRREGFIKVQMPSNSHPEASGAAPQEGNFENGPARPIASNRRSLGSALNVDLDERSVTARVKLSAAEKRDLRNAADTARTSGAAKGVPQMVVIVFDKINLREKGKDGGYFYNVYLNLPVGARSAQERQRFLLGTVGAFAIDAASHHGTATIEFPASEKLADMDLSTASDLSVSLVRINGANSPKGKVIKIGEVRVDIVAGDAPLNSSVVTPKPPKACSYNC
ncbi:MAG: tyrosinase family protein [Herminiimonas sp.]|nr:tyrosinase family protein [Herminiimonas sp.]